MATVRRKILKTKTTTKTKPRPKAQAQSRARAQGRGQGQGKKVIHARTKTPDVSQLQGFARLAVTDPARLKAISAKAGKRAQKLHGKRVRWSATKARAMAPKGGRAIQKLWRLGQGPALQTRPVPVKKRKAAPAKKRARRLLPGSQAQVPPPEALPSQEVTPDQQATPTPVQVPEPMPIPEPIPEPEPGTIEAPNGTQADESADPAIGDLV